VVEATSTELVSNDDSDLSDVEDRGYVEVKVHRRRSVLRVTTKRTERSCIKKLYNNTEQVASQFSVG